MGDETAPLRTLKPTPSNIHKDIKHPISWMSLSKFSFQGKSNTFKVISSVIVVIVAYLLSLLISLVILLTLFSGPELVVIRSSTTLSEDWPFEVAIHDLCNRGSTITLRSLEVCRRVPEACFRLTEPVTIPGYGCFDVNASFRLIINNTLAVFDEASKVCVTSFSATYEWGFPIPLVNPFSCYNLSSNNNERTGSNRMDSFNVAVSFLRGFSTIEEDQANLTLALAVNVSSTSLALDFPIPALQLEVFNMGSSMGTLYIPPFQISVGLARVMYPTPTYIISSSQSSELGTIMSNHTLPLYVNITSTCKSECFLTDLFSSYYRFQRYERKAISIPSSPGYTFNSAALIKVSWDTSADAASSFELQLMLEDELLGKFDMTIPETQVIFYIAESRVPAFTVTLDSKTLTFGKERVIVNLEVEVSHPEFTSLIESVLYPSKSTSITLNMDLPKNPSIAPLVSWVNMSTHTSKYRILSASEVTKLTRQLSLQSSSASTLELDFTITVYLVSIADLGYPSLSIPELQLRFSYGEESIGSFGFAYTSGFLSSSVYASLLINPDQQSSVDDTMNTSRTSNTWEQVASAVLRGESVILDFEFEIGDFQSHFSAPLPSGLVSSPVIQSISLVYSDTFCSMNLTAGNYTSPIDPEIASLTMVVYNPLQSASGNLDIEILGTSIVSVKLPGLSDSFLRAQHPNDSSTSYGKSSYIVAENSVKTISFQIVILDDPAVESVNKFCESNDNFLYEQSLDWDDNGISRIFMSIQNTRLYYYPVDLSK